MNVFSQVVWDEEEDEAGRFEPSVLERITGPEFMAEEPWDQEHVGGGRHIWITAKEQVIAIHFALHVLGQCCDHIGWELYKRQPRCCCFALNQYGYSLGPE